MKYTIILVLISSILFGCRTSDERYAYELYNKGLIEIKKGNLNKAKECFLQTLSYFHLPNAYKSLASINILNANFMRAKKNYKKALYYLNEKWLNKPSKKIKNAILDIYFELACLESRMERNDFALAYLWEAALNGFKNTHKILNSPHLSSLKGLKEIKSILGYMKTSIPKIKIKNKKIFTFYKKFNPFEASGEISREDWLKIKSNSISTKTKWKILFSKYNVSKTKCILYAVYYNNEGSPVKMDVLSPTKQNKFPVNLFQIYYFFKDGRLKKYVDIPPIKKGWGMEVNYFYKGTSYFIKKVIRKKKFFPYYIEKILVEKYKRYM